MWRGRGCCGRCMGVILLGSICQVACTLKVRSTGERNMDGKGTCGRADRCSCFIDGNRHQSFPPALTASLPGFSRYLQIPNPVPLESSARAICIFLWCILYPYILGYGFIFLFHPVKVSVCLNIPRNV